MRRSRGGSMKIVKVKSNLEPPPPGKLIIIRTPPGKKFWILACNLIIHYDLKKKNVDKLGINFAYIITKLTYPLSPKNMGFWFLMSIPYFFIFHVVFFYFDLTTLFCKSMNTFIQIHDNCNDNMCRARVDLPTP